MAFRNGYCLSLLNSVSISHVVNRYRSEAIQSVELDHVRNENPVDKPRLLTCCFDQRVCIHEHQQSTWNLWKDRHLQPSNLYLSPGQDRTTNADACQTNFHRKQDLHLPLETQSSLSSSGTIVVINSLGSRHCLFLSGPITACCVYVLLRLLNP
jgi:hypothetical protein